jgi:NAD(P)-dependent dehydrogenase (short-subunit alcohol dehydrogenase family)
MTRQLDGKVALITGAGAGIGEAIARRFAEEGAKIVVAERDERTGRDVADAIDGLFVHVDVAVRDQVENAVAQAVSEYGSIDIVVNNAWAAARSAEWRTRPISNSATVSRLPITGRSGRCAPPYRICGQAVGGG